MKLRVSKPRLKFSTFTNSSLSTKMMIIFIGINIAGLSLLTFVIFNRSVNIQEETSLKLGKEIALHQSFNAKKIMEEQLLISRTISGAIENYRGIPEGQRRNSYRAMMSGVFLKTPNIMNMYIIMEDNAVDKLDSIYGRTKKSGRFYNSMNRFGNKITIINDLYFTPEGDWYETPAKIKKEYATDPYFWQYKGEDSKRFVVSLVNPVFDKEKFLGIVGTDCPLDYLQETLSSIRPYGTGHVFLVSNNSTIVTYPETAMVGKSFADNFPEDKKEEIKSIIKDGKESTLQLKIGETEYQLVMVPFKIGNSPRPWSFCVALPMDEVMKPMRSLLADSIIIALIIISLLAIVIFIFARKFTRPITQGLDFAQKISQGDFTERIDVTSGDEIGRLSIALNSAADNLEKLISNIMSSANQLAKAVQEIAAGNQNLSQRTSEQASALEEIASTIEEATAAINQNAENATEASSLSQKSSNIAIQGGEQVVEAVNSISAVSESSKRIENIITVIDEIAFQTNLLALNAAVEAARAGDQGRGFAVVAGEVRNLAQRSAEAAKEISGLIKESLDKVENSVEMSGKSSNSLEEIIDSIKSVTAMIQEIAAASGEQKDGMRQINTAVSEMDNMTQQNAALVEEIASAGEEMTNQAQEMLSMMEQFKINKDFNL